jgi:hypothetical protein
MSAPPRLPLALGLALCLAPADGRAQQVGAPELLGTIAGPGAVHQPVGVAFYGTDLGWTFEHQGQLRILFGDTWPTDDSVCGGFPQNDDSQATLPLAFPGAAPPLDVETPPGDPTQFARIRLFRGGQPLGLSYGQVPLAGWSDGARAAALFGRGVAIACEVRESGPRLCRSPETAPGEPPIFPSGKYLTCATELGTCHPDSFGLGLPCDVATHAGCSPGETCQPSPTGFCIDPTSPRLTESSASLAYATVHEQEIGVERPGEPAVYDSVARWRTNKFINAGARAVARFTKTGVGADWRVGDDALLVWGRPFWVRDRDTGPLHMYLAVIRLPVARKNGAPRDAFRPLFFAGLDASGRPRWTTNEAHAAPLAMDGVPGGSPDDVQTIPNQQGIAWVGAPIHKWVMLYGGGAVYNLVPEPGPVRGAIRIRFADQPWGPWSPAEVHLAPGNPRTAGDLYGPGGVMFHPACRDQGALLCADPDPHRPLDSLEPGCSSLLGAVDLGILYAPNVIDAWSKPDGAGGFDLYWNVSIWNPYAVLLYRTKLLPP